MIVMCHLDKKKCAKKKKDGHKGQPNDFLCYSPIDREAYSDLGQNGTQMIAWMSRTDLARNSVTILGPIERGMRRTVSPGIKPRPPY
jgi:hypothetical protein